MPAPAPTRLSELPLTLSCVDRPPLVVSTALRDSVAVVLLWRLGCACSQAALDVVAALAEERPTIAALAVHSPVEPPERDPARLTRAVEFVRSALTVAIDEPRELARRAGVRALPALLVIDALGAVRFVGHGLPGLPRLLRAVDDLQHEAGERAARDEGQLDRVDLPLLATPLPRSRPQRVLVPTALASDGDTLWVGSRARGSVLAITGRGEIAAEIAGPRWPTAIAPIDEQVLVSDWDGHEIWSVDRAGAAAPILGIGQCGDDVYGGGFGDQQELAFPSGLAAAGGVSGAYFAQAGTHQIWQLDPETGAASAWVGTGARGLVDGAEQAEFSEPCGVAGNDYLLAVADAGNHAVRIVELGHNFCETVAQGLDRPVAITLGPARPAGADGSTADGSTADGASGGAGADAAPDGEDALYVAASWRPAIVRIAPTGGGRPETVLDHRHGLVEPVGLAFHGHELVVADAGADAVFAFDLTKDPVTSRRVLPVAGRPLPALPDPQHEVHRTRGAPVVVAAPIAALEFTDLLLRIHLPVGPGEELDGTAPCEVAIVDERDPVLAAARSVTVELESEHVPVLIAIDERGEGVLRVRVRAMVRSADDGDAPPASREFCYLVPIEVGVTGDTEAEVRAPADEAGGGAAQLPG